MAIVINNTPVDYSSAQGDLIFTVYEATKANDPVTYPDYKYVCDVYVGATLVTRLKSVPRPDNKRGVFNVASIIRNYIAAQFNPTDFQLRAQQMGVGEFFVKATLKFGEEYGFTLYTNLTVDSERTYFNHYNGRMYGDKTVLLNKVDKGLSNRPFETPVDRNSSRCFIPFFPTDTDAVTLRIRTYNSSGLLDTKTQNFTPAAAFTLQQYNVAPNVLNSVWANLINDTVAYYTVEFLSPNVSPDWICRLNLTCEPRYEVVSLAFLNKYGGFESREFTKVSRKSISIQKEEFGKLPYSIDSSGMVSYYNSNNVYNETRSIYSSQYTEKLILNTDILTDEEFKWLGELILSPMVFLEQFGYYFPVSIKAENYDFNKRINDKLTNLTVNVEMGDQFNAQYR